MPCPLQGGGLFLASSEITLDGKYPLNTHGGQLSQGRMHGFRFLYEACVQLRGKDGARQTQGSPERAVVEAGGGAICGCLIVSKERGLAKGRARRRVGVST